MPCPFCDNQQEPSWVSCPCPGANSARLVGFKLAWQHHQIQPSQPNELNSAALKGANQAAGKDQASIIAALSEITPKASPHQPQKDKPTRDVEDCGPEASAFSTHSKSAFSPWNQAILRFSEGIAATNPDLAGWVHRAASAFLAGESVPKRRPPKVAGKATKAARAG